MRKPDYEANGVRLYCGDCLEILPELEAGSVDAVVTDPPFGVRSDDWDDMDEHEFARFSFAWLSQARKLSECLVSFYASRTEFASWCKFLYPRVRQLIWHKPLGSQYAGASESRMWYAYEPIAHCFVKERFEVAKPKTMRVANLIREAREAAGMSRGAVDMVIRGKKTGLCYRWEEAACLPTDEQSAVLVATIGLGQEFREALAEACADRDDTLEKMAERSAERAAERADVLSYRTITGGEHPCEKPIDLLMDLVASVTDEGESVLDPFMGSCSTGKACIRSGRSFIGIEKEPKYFALAVRRIEAELNRHPLFDAPAQRPPAPERET